MSKKRPIFFLCCAATLGTYGGLSYALSWNYLGAFALALLALIPLSPQRMRIVSFCGFTGLLCALNAQYQKIIYEEKLELISKEYPIHGLVLDVRVLSGWEKKVRIKTSSSTIELTLKDAASMLPLQPGYRVSVATTLQSMKPPLSPVLFDAYSYGLTHGIHAHAFIKDPELIIFQEGAPPLLSFLRSSLRQEIFAHLAPHQASLLLALILGETDLFSRSQKEIYRIIGAQHLLAVSGLQVSMLAAICFIILTLFLNLLLPPHCSLVAARIGALLSIFFVWFFVALCHNPPSATRAGLMATVALFPALFGRTVDLFDALLVSCFLSLLFDPLSIKDLGFLLSYAATLGLICTHYAGQSWTIILRAQSVLGALLFT